MDVPSLYTSINHDKGEEACLRKLDKRKNKSVLSIAIKNVILAISISKAFPFANEYDRQLNFTALETIVASNYINFEHNLFQEYFQETVLSTLL